eukprot:1098508-Rhodomonas_salina.1
MWAGVGRGPASKQDARRTGREVGSAQGVRASARSVGAGHRATQSPRAPRHPGTSRPLPPVTPTGSVVGGHGSVWGGHVGGDASVSSMAEVSQLSSRHGSSEPDAGVQTWRMEGG